MTVISQQGIRPKNRGDWRRAETPDPAQIREGHLCRVRRAHAGRPHGALARRILSPIRLAGVSVSVSGTPAHQPFSQPGLKLDAEGAASFNPAMAKSLAGKTAGLLRGVFCIGILGLASTVHADETLLSNLPSNDGGQGIVSSGTQRAVSFTTSGTAFSVTSVTMRLTNYISSTDTALLTFRLNDGDSPSATVFASLNAPASASNADGNFVFTPTSGITLTANTTYWLVIAAASNTETFSWLRSDPSETPTGLATFGIQAISENSGGTWSEGSNGPHSFAINGNTVPEPGTILLVGLGLAGLLFVRRRAV